MSRSRQRGGRNRRGRQRNQRQRNDRLNINEVHNGIQRGVDRTRVESYNRFPGFRLWYRPQIGNVRPSYEAHFYLRNNPERPPLNDEISETIMASCYEYMTEYQHTNREVFEAQNMVVCSLTIWDPSNDEETPGLEIRNDDVHFSIAGIMHLVYFMNPPEATWCHEHIYFLEPNSNE